MIFSLCSALASFAQGNGMAGISEATNMVTSYFDPLTKLIFAVATITRKTHERNSAVADFEASGSPDENFE